MSESIAEAVARVRGRYSKTEWTRPPRTLAQAIKRIGDLQHAIGWMLQDIGHHDYAWEDWARERRHYENLIESSWNANDARLQHVPCNCGGHGCTSDKQSGTTSGGEW